MSSAADLGKFMLALAEGNFLHPESLSEMKQWTATGEEDTNYGLGLYMLDLSGSKRVNNDNLVLVIQSTNM